MCQRITYELKRGDTLYALAKKYNTTVPSIMVLNPTLNPRNLRIGNKIIICPNTDFFDQNSAIFSVIGASNEETPSNYITTNQLKLIDEMRKIWSQQTCWVKGAIVSICDNLDDEKYVIERLMENPADIADVFAKYYNANQAREIALLLSEELELVVALIRSICGKNRTEATEINNKCYKSANSIVDLLTNINPHYKKDALRQMFYNNLDLTTNEIILRVAKNYPAQIKATDNADNEILDLVDYLSYGIMTQFQNAFE